MDTFRKWLNKPKADDKSLLARFYHADRSLTAVASELDSFDGRAEPDRCSRLVSRLRQSQDKVLAITNLIMDELLGEDRDPRSFRAKFPEEVLQENLAGQLWFGAECLAAGSSIMNREQESKEMRPLAQAVTKSLGNVRNLLRDQCLRNNVPNSRTLHLDLNDTNTEQLCESLKIFDRLFAEFELRYVSAMVQVKTKHEYEMQELICVLFSETLQRALSIGLLEQDKVDAFDPALMFSIPRLAIIAGLVIYNKGPLNMDMAADQLSEMFRPFRTILIKIRDLLRTLNKNELYQLERLLCTNEDIQLKVQVGSSSIEAPSSSDQQNNNGKNSNSNNCDDSSTAATDNITTAVTATSTDTNMTPDNNNTLDSTTTQIHSSNNISTSPKSVLNTANGGTHSRKDVYAALRLAAHSPVSSLSADSSAASTPSVSPAASPTPSHSIASTTSSAVSTSTTSPADWTDDDEDDVADEDVDDDNSELPKELDIVAADCASGYLIPNTNFGNLLQPQEVPLTDNFIASEDEFGSNQTDAEENAYATPADMPTTSNASHHKRIPNTHTDSSEESDQLTIKASIKSERSSASSNVSGASKSGESGSCSSSSCRKHRQQQQLKSHERQENSGGGSSTGSDASRRHHHHHHLHPHRHQHHHHHHHHHRHHQHSKSKRSSLVENASEEHKDVIAATETATETTTNATMTAQWPTTGKAATQNVREDTASADSSTSSSLSDGDPHEVSLALRAAGRLKFKSTENLLHRLFVCIAGVADQLQTNFASDLRQILRSVFLMNMSSAQEEIIDIPEKTKDSELFEFRASENDVIQESAGSNQSIYSAEEVNPELDNVFSGNSTTVAASGAGIQRVNTFDLGGGTSDVTATTNNARNHVARSRSLGDQENNETTSTNASGNNRHLSAYINGRRLSSPPRQSANQQQLQRHRNRNNSVGTNSTSSDTSSSSESNSPVSERVSATATRLQSNSTTATNVYNNNGVETTPPSIAHSQPPQSSRLAPPAWIPDEKAPRCMSCHTPFTAFRRRHHCRNCGGVFCGVCSNASAPLPKYGLTKAVRMCRECYVREMRATSAIRNNTTPHVAVTTAGGS